MLLSVILYLDYFLFFIIWTVFMYFGQMVLFIIFDAHCSINYYFKSFGLSYKSQMTLIQLESVTNVGFITDRVTYQYNR